MTIAHQPARGRLARFWLAILAVASGLALSTPAQAVESADPAGLLRVTLADALTGNTIAAMR